MRVLVFDNEVDVLLLFKLFLNKIGHEVFTRENCHQLFETVSFIRPDLIVMDNTMPEITGFEATQKLKEDSEFSRIPVIFCSGDEQALSLAAEAKADYFLPKPFSKYALENIIVRIRNKYLRHRLS
jgi:CheY-like chemotaxis protein